MAPKKTTTKKGSPTADEAATIAFGAAQPRELKSIDRLKEILLGSTHEQSWNQIGEWEKDIKRELVKIDLATHQGMKQLLKWVKEHIDDANDLLQSASSKELSDTERDSVLRFKDFLMFFLGFFGEAKDILTSISAEVEKELALQGEDVDSEDDEDDDEEV